MSPRSAMAWSSTGAVKRERQRDLAALALAFDRRVELAEEADLALLAEADDVARRELLAGPAKARQREPSSRSVSVASIFGVRAAADAAARQPRRDHLGVVDHQRIAGIEQVRQVAHALVRKLRRAARPHHQQPRRIARRNRPQRDALGRQVEIEQVGAHETPASFRARRS